MPVPIKLRDNSSIVKVKTTSPDNIKVKSDCDVEKTRLDALIHQEKVERIEADEVLQTEIFKKQDKIDFIYITEPSGTLDILSLNLLVRNLVNRIVLNGTIYYLSIREGNIRKYFTTQSAVYNEIDVDMTTGDYTAIQVLNPTVAAHIDNGSIHVTADEKDFWNNKITSYMDTLDEENLILTKN